MLTKHFQSKDKTAIFGLSAIVTALLFVVIVGGVLYKAVSTALFVSEEAGAVNTPRIKDKELLQAIQEIEEWRQNNTETEQPVVTDQPSTDLTPIPQPKEPRIALYNGTDIEGFASESADKLTAAGFTLIEEIGNAESQDYTRTVIRAKQEHASQIEVLVQALGLSENSVTRESLDEEESVDIEIILGSSNS